MDECGDVCPSWTRQLLLKRDEVWPVIGWFDCPRVSTQAKDGTKSVEFMQLLMVLKRKKEQNNLECVVTSAWSLIWRMESAASLLGLIHKQRRHQNTDRIFILFGCSCKNYNLLSFHRNDGRALRELNIPCHSNVHFTGSLPP